jgi:hypothetical protein
MFYFATKYEHLSLESVGVIIEFKQDSTVQGTSKSRELFLVKERGINGMGLDKFHDKEATFSTHTQYNAPDVIIMTSDSSHVHRTVYIVAQALKTTGAITGRKVVGNDVNAVPILEKDR